MSRRPTQRHPPAQLLFAVRAAFLSTIRAECPAVLDDLWDAVFVPLPAFTRRPGSRRSPLRPEVHPEGRAKSSRTASSQSARYID